MEIAGIPVTVGALGSLLSACYSVVQGINTLRQKYKFMAVTLISILNTCNGTRLVLGQVDKIFASNSSATQHLFKQHREIFEGIKIGCAMTLSLLETHVQILLDVAGSDGPLAAQNLGKLERIKALYNESDMRVLHEQLKDQNATLNQILTVLQRLVLCNEQTMGISTK